MYEQKVQKFKLSTYLILFNKNLKLRHVFLFATMHKKDDCQKLTRNFLVFSQKNQIVKQLHASIVLCMKQIIVINFTQVSKSVCLWLIIVIIKLVGKLTDMFYYICSTISSQIVNFPHAKCDCPRVTFFHQHNNV